MEALCHPTVKLTNIMPINCEQETEHLLRRQTSQGTGEDNKDSAAQSRDSSHFPLLINHMTTRTEAEGITAGHWTFKEVLDKLLIIVVMPVRQTLNQVILKQNNLSLVICMMLSPSVERHRNT